MSVFRKNELYKVTLVLVERQMYFINSAGVHTLGAIELRTDGICSSIISVGGPDSLDHHYSIVIHNYGQRLIRVAQRGYSFLPRPSSRRH